jgi:hypothetical protein
LIIEGRDVGISVEVDTSDRTRPGEMRSGASPAEVIALALVGAAGREGLRLLDRLFDATVEWVVRHRQKDDESVYVKLYGPDGEVMRTVEVPQDGDPIER